MKLKTLSVYCLLLYIFILDTEKSAAQIVNVESARMQSDTVGWMGSFGTSFTMNKNKVKIFGAS
ncbi:MAG TPA: hypothetical protein PK977_03595, partial [Chitinophagaceae bacterium]|nr:hypothetical protein [Chitinophagaceae bacterium]